MNDPISLEVRRRKPDLDVVKACEELLAAAKSGEMLWLRATFGVGDETCTVFAGYCDTRDLLLGLELMRLRALSVMIQKSE